VIPRSRGPAPSDHPAYSPGRRTALVLCGSGAHGAYHAGALRALHEAGVKVDVVAGQGVGAAAAALAAIDGAARLWEPDGPWRSGAARRFYRWKLSLRLLAVVGAALLAILAVPLAVLAAGLVVYVAGFLLTLLGLPAGGAVISWNASWLQAAFADDRLPLIVPRLVMVMATLLVTAAAVGVIVERWRAPAQRRSAGGWWWQLTGAPIDAGGARHAFVDLVWQLIRGATILARPSPVAVGRRFAEVLAEGVGQPGFRELLAVATDLDARRDIVVALLREPFRSSFLAPHGGHNRRAEVLDLGGVGRDHAIDVLAAAMTPAVICEPALVTFTAQGFWRGETHRMCDRPGSVVRLLEEVRAAGVTQVVMVTAVPGGSQPHRLRMPRLEPRQRLGEFLTAAGSAALLDALETAAGRFEAVYVIAPAHNAAGPFDFDPVYDEASDRMQSLTELVERGYEDAYHQFVDPIVGDSGDQLAQPASEPLRISFERN
jgi:hypothetical protein